eukprot:16070897-Heterocapsa_arctica.AAC.1
MSPRNLHAADQIEEAPPRVVVITHHVVLDRDHADPSASPPTVSRTRAGRSCHASWPRHVGLRGHLLRQLLM